MLKEATVRVLREQRLASVKKDGARITEIAMENGNIFRARMFIDCTYEGDLMAKAGGAEKVFRMSEEQWKTTIDLLQTYGGLKDAAPASSYFTNDYLPPA